MKFILFYCENRYRSSTNSKCININRSEDVFLLSTNSSVIINLFLFFFKKKQLFLVVMEKNQNYYLNIKSLIYGLTHN